MSVVKALARHSATVRHLFNYLNRGGRSLACDLCNLSDGDWWREMDRTRAAYGHDRALRRGRCRTYYHFILAPSPGDFAGVGPEEGLAKVRAMATSWCNRILGDDYQYAIVYHGDAGCGNVHAHVVCGVTNLRTGLKLQVADRDVERMKRAANECSRKAGLSAYEDMVDGAAAERAALGKANERRASRGERSVPASPAPRSRRRACTPAVLPQAQRRAARRFRPWKDDLRMAIDAAASESSTFGEFRESLNRMGGDVRTNRRGELVYSWSWRGERREVRDFRLGMSYQTDLLAARFMDLRFTRAARSARGGLFLQAAAEEGVIVPKASLREVSLAQATAHSHGAWTIDEVRASVSALREDVRQMEEAREDLSFALSRLESDLRDRIALEQFRKGGAGPGASCPAGGAPSALERLERRPYATGVASLRGSIDTNRAKLARLEETMRGRESDLESLTRAEGVLSRLVDFTERGAASEAILYGGLIARGAERRARGGRRVPGRGPRGVRAPAMPSPAPSCRPPCSEDPVFMRVTDPAARRHDRAPLGLDDSYRPTWPPYGKNDLRHPPREDAGTARCPEGRPQEGPGGAAAPASVPHRHER